MALYANLYGPTEFEYPGGSSVRSVPIAVRRVDDDTFATLYADRDKVATVVNPVRTDDYGNLSFWVDPGEYFLDAPGNAGMFITVPKHPYEPASGGGGGGDGSPYTHTQSGAAETWTIEHNLGYLPTAFLTQETTGDYLYFFGIEENNAVRSIISFGAATAGTCQVK